MSNTQHTDFQFDNEVRDTDINDNESESSESDNEEGEIINLFPLNND